MKFPITSAPDRNPGFYCKLFAQELLPRDDDTLARAARCFHMAWWCIQRSIPHENLQDLLIIPGHMHVEGVGYLGRQ